MTPRSDYLCRLWQSDSGNGAVDPRDLLRELERRSRSFDRMIRRRDIREIAGGLALTVIYGLMAWKAGTLLYRVSDIWLAACGVWFAYYLRRDSKRSLQPVPDQSLAVYRQSLMERYDGQIRLARSVKYWFLLPMWFGLLLQAVASRLDGGSWFKFSMIMLVATVGNGFVWWLNEGPGIRYLERKRRQLAALIGEDGGLK
jgi:hypothetical protein